MVTSGWYWFGLSVYFIIILVVGYNASRRTKSVTDFYVAGRTLGPMVLALTYVATYSSASSWIGVPGLAYRFGWSVFHIFGAGTIGVVLGHLIAAKKLRDAAERVNALTLCDILEKRYNSKLLRAFGAVVIIIGSFFIMVAQFKGVGVVFSQMFGISFQTSVVVFAVIVAVYLAFGGFFAVAWTDAVQGFIMMAGMLLVGITAIVYVGGFGELNAKLAEINPEMLNFTGPKQWLWLPAMLGAWGVVGLGAVSVPYMIVRFITYKQGPGVLGKSVVLGTIAHAIFSLAVVCGLIAAVVVPGLKDFDTAMPSLILQILHPALAAFILAAIVAAVMSTVDSGLILVGQSFARDIYQELISSEEEVSQAQLLVISRVIVVVITAISAVLAFWPPPFLSLMLYLGFGVMGSTFLCSLILGLWWKRVNFWGALAGFIVPLSVYLGDRFWNFTGSGFIRYLIAVVLGLIATVVLSLLTPPQSKEELRPVFGESA